jgi:hypothetical protein
MRNRGRPLLQLLIVSGLDGLFPGIQNFVELVDRLGPLLGVEIIEGFVVVAAVLWRGLPLEAGQLVGVPEQQVVRELAME